MAAIFIRGIDVTTQAFVHISKFQDTPGIGLDCNCICWRCGERIGSRIFSSSPSSSCFFHEADTENKKCNGGEVETDIHFFAKEVFCRHLEVFLPDPFGNSERVSFKYENVRLEKKLHDFRPDLVLISGNGEQLIVEITVSHGTFNNPVKMEKLRNAGLPSIEILLDRDLLTGSEIINYDSFAEAYKKKLIEEVRIPTKQWLVKPKDNLTLEKHVPAQSKAESTGIEWFVAALFVVIFGPKIFRWIKSKFT